MRVWRGLEILLLIFAQALALASDGGAAHASAARTSAGGGARTGFLSRSSRLCAALLTLPAGAGDAVVIGRIADAYMELLTGSGAGLVPPEELRAVLDSGKLFDLPEGSSARDHLRDGLRELESVARRVGDPKALLAELSRRLTAYVRDGARAADKRRATRQDRSKVPDLVRSIPLPKLGIRGESRIDAIAPDGTRAVIEESEPNLHRHYWIVNLGPATAPRPIHLNLFESPAVGDRISEFKFSDDSATLAFRSPEGVTVVDAATGTVLRSFGPHTGVRSYRLSPDGKHVVYHWCDRADGLRRRWFLGEVATGKSRELALPADFERALQKHASRFTDYSEQARNEEYRLEISADGTKAVLWAALVHKDYSEMQVSKTHLESFLVSWRLPTGDLFDFFHFDTTKHTALLALSPDGTKALLFQGDRAPFVRDLALHGSRESNEEMGFLGWYAGRAAFVPGSRLLATVSFVGGAARRVEAIKIWDTGTIGKPFAPLLTIPHVDNNQDQVTLSFSQDGSLLRIQGAGWYVRTIRLSDQREVGNFKYTSPSSAIFGNPAFLAGNGVFSRDGAVCLAVEKDALRIWYVDQILKDEREARSGER